MYYNNHMYVGYYKTSVGYIKIKADDHYLLSCFFVDEMDEVENRNDVINQTLCQLNEYFHHQRITFDLPLKLIGTDFQIKVWKALMDIPYGQTCSYKDIAIAIGNPKAVRAVGGANNKNKIAIIIPCHRVIGSNSKMIGYATGIYRKEFLLRHEGLNY